MESRRRVEENGKLKQRVAELEGIREEYEKTKEQLAAQKKELEFIFDMLPVGLSIIGYDHNVISINKEMARILKAPKEQLLANSAHISEYCNADGSPMPFDEIPGMRALVEKRRIDKSELGIVRDDGSVVWTSVTAAPLDGVGVVLAGADITEIRKRETAYRAIVDTAREAIFIIESDGSLRFMNHAAERLMKGVIKGDILAEARSVDLALRLASISEKTQCSGKPSVEEMQVAVEGTVRWFLADCQTFTNIPGGTVSTLIILTDVTALKTAEEELTLIRRELESKAAILEETNIALKVLLRTQRDEKTAVVSTIRRSMELLVNPYVTMLVKKSATPEQAEIAAIIATNLEEILKAIPTSPADIDAILTPAELQIASLIRQGKTTKEITAILNISENTVASHRKRIRYKLGLVDSKKNLTIHLRNADAENGAP